MKFTPERTNYYPSSMSFSAGFLGPRGDVGFIMRADFEKAIEIVSGLLSQGRKIESAKMGLDGDWDINSETIFEDGSFVESYDTWDHSQWEEKQKSIA